MSASLAGLGFLGRRILRMPVFTTNDSAEATRVLQEPFSNEKALQTWFEANLETVLGVRFIKSEHPTGVEHGGRIDTLGIDELGTPVIIEYKWDTSESVINQGLFYRAWLVDHRGDFELLAQKALGSGIEVDWSQPRLVIIAGGFSKYDVWAIKEMPRGIELYRYTRYAGGTLVVEAVNDTPSPRKNETPAPPPPTSGAIEYDLDYHLSRTGSEQRLAFEELREQIMELDGVEERVNQKTQITYRTTRSFAALDFRPTHILCQFKGPDELPHDVDPDGVAKDIRSWRWGYQWAVHLTGPADVEAVFRLIRFSHDFER